MSLVISNIKGTGDILMGVIKHDKELLTQIQNSEFIPMLIQQEKGCIINPEGVAKVLEELTKLLAKRGIFDNNCKD
jgi:hypothetical protein